MGILKTILILAAAVSGFAACSVTATDGASRSERNRITEVQLTASNVENLYQAVEKLRPEWLTSRGPTSVTNAAPAVPSVYMDGQIVGKSDYLRDVRLIDVGEVKFWPAGQAAARFGTGHPRGVIEIIRK